MARPSDPKKQESIFEIALFAVGTVTAMTFLIWLFRSNKIVWGSLNPMMATGSMWKWLPGGWGLGSWNELVITAVRFSKDVSAVSFVEWLGFINLGLWPLAVLLGLSYLVALPILLARKTRRVNRALTPSELLAQMTAVFSGVAPVVKIRKKIVADELPEWRTQVSPDEVFLGKVGNKPMVNAGGEFDKDVARAYFAGLQSQRIDGRMISAQLGRQVVDLVVDVNRSKKICYPDRLSNEGKALYALWSAVAFGGEAGKKEYEEYSRLLNMSAYGSPTGMANLTVIQPLYNKYRTHKNGLNLFAVHHWEHTVLFALLQYAQTRGRYTTAEVLWLRPTNRIMFFALNSCGAKTPHTEAAATFNQHAYETICFEEGLLPLQQTPTGFQHVIFVEGAIEGLEAEYRHWAISKDENDVWWNKDLRGIHDSSVRSLLAQFADEAKKSIPKEQAPEASEFDKTMSESAHAEESSSVTETL